MWIADFCETLGDREDGKVSGIAVRDFVPVKRRGDTGVRKRTYRIRRAGSAVFGVLVVVEKYAMTLFLPPLRTGQSGRTPLHSARKCNSCTAHFRERPARFDPYIDVHAARTAGFGPAAKP